jgi:hypothetical protein
VLGIRVVADSTGARIGVGVAVVVAYLIGWALIATRGSGPSSGR